MSFMLMFIFLSILQFSFTTIVHSIPKVNFLSIESCRTKKLSTIKSPLVPQLMCFFMLICIFCRYVYNI